MGTSWHDVITAKRLGRDELLKVHAIGEVTIFKQLRAVGPGNLQMRKPYVAACAVQRVPDVPPALRPTLAKSAVDGHRHSWFLKSGVRCSAAHDMRDGHRDAPKVVEILSHTPVTEGHPSQVVPISIPA